MARKYPKPFAETVEFPNNCPCRVRTRQSMIDELPVPHFASTIEIVLTEGVAGSVHVGNQRFEADPCRDAFFIPPDTVHYTEFRRGEGKIHVFKISLEMLTQYINISGILGRQEHTFQSLPNHLTSRFDFLYGIVFNRISYDGKGLSAFSGILELFEGLDRLSSGDENQDRQISDKILHIIKWSQEHVCAKIAVEDAAAELHYSKYHFCRLFKENTGMTYLQYLNNLKINHAIKLMKEGKSATFCCYECGFTNLAYFLQLFKEVTGYTSKEYKRLLDEQK